MNDRHFFDSNVILYAYDSRDSRKQTIALDRIEEGLAGGQAYISSQVVQECLNWLSKRQMAFADNERICREVLEPLCSKPLSHFALCYEAMRIKERLKYGFYDALIIAAALRLNCKILYSEDLQHNQRIETLTIRNPFQE